MYHSQCVLNESLFVFFGETHRYALHNSIERINARNVVNGIPENWIHIKLQNDIQSRNYTLSAPIDENEIAILGGMDKKDDAIGEVLLYNI